MKVLNLTTVKQICRVGGELESDLLVVLSNQVEATVSEYTGLLWEPEDITMTASGGGENLWPPQGPINSVSEVRHIEDDYVVSSTWYEVIRNNRIKSHTRWIDGYYKITANVGYATVPDELIGIMYALVKRAYISSGGVSNESSAGHQVAMREIHTTDEWRQLRKYKLGDIL